MRLISHVQTSNREAPVFYRVWTVSVDTPCSISLSGWRDTICTICQSLLYLRHILDIELSYYGEAKSVYAH